MYSRERVYRQMPDFSENLMMGLSSRARNHFVRYSGSLGSWFVPVVEEMIDEHGKGVNELMEVSKLEGQQGIVLDIGQPYAVENPDRKDPHGNDWALIRIHRHPDSI